METIEPKIRFWRREQTFKEWKALIAISHATITALRGATLFLIEDSMMLATESTMYSSMLCLLFFIIDRPVMNVILAYFDLPFLFKNHYAGLLIYTNQFHNSESHCTSVTLDCIYSKIGYYLATICVILNWCKIVPLITSTVIYINSFGFRPFPHKNSKILLGTRDSVNKSNGYPVEDMLQFFDQHSVLNTIDLNFGRYLTDDAYRCKIFDTPEFPKTFSMKSLTNLRNMNTFAFSIPEIVNKERKVTIPAQYHFCYSYVDVTQIVYPPTP
uniref:G protein-coupled receptor n=1 Tax=Parastrongyloides trichosuri TaxID=131310 RepID=A0A0N4Z2J6_PARTI